MAAPHLNTSSSSDSGSVAAPPARAANRSATVAGMLLGFGAIVRDWPTLVILTVPLVVIYLLTVRHEERRMAALFPDAWPAYRDRTPRFIPYRPIMPRLEGWSLKQWLRNHEYRAWIGSAIMVASLVIWHLWW